MPRKRPWTYDDMIHHIAVRNARAVPVPIWCRLFGTAFRESGAVPLAHVLAEALTEYVERHPRPRGRARPAR